MTLLEWTLLCMTLIVGLTSGRLMSRWWHWLVWCFVIFSFAWLSVVLKGTHILYGVALFSAVALLPPAAYVFKSLPKPIELMSPIFMLAGLAVIWDICLVFYTLMS